MSKRIRKPRSLYCSFCGKDREEVGDMVAGPSVLICNECVQSAREIITERALEKAATVAVIRPKFGTKAAG